MLVDSRWQGKHGIGRYAAEVLSRLDMPWTPISEGGRPSSPADFLTKSLKVDGRRPRAVYSPGYNGFLSRIPQTVTVLDLIHLAGSNSAKYRPYYDLFLKPLIRRNGHVLTISETSRGHVEEWLGDPSVDVINAGMGSTPEFSLDGDVYSGKNPYFLYVGNLKPHKNVDSIVRAMRLIDGYDLYIVCSDEDGVRSLAAQSGVAEKVHTFSNIDDTFMATLYRGARATIQPSIIEGFGLPALEGALCGSPVVYWRGCESVDEICAGGGHPVDDAYDVEGWAHALESIGEGERFPEGLVTADSYSWDSVGATISNTLRTRHGAATS